MRSLISVLVAVEAAGFLVLAPSHLLFLPVGGVLVVAGLLRVNASEFADVATLAAVAVGLATVLLEMVTGGANSPVADALNRAALLALMATGLFQITTPSWFSTGRSTAAVRIRR